MGGGISGIGGSGGYYEPIQGSEKSDKPLGALPSTILDVSNTFNEINKKFQLTVRLDLQEMLGLKNKLELAKKDPSLSNYHKTTIQKALDACSGVCQYLKQTGKVDFSDYAIMQINIQDAVLIQ